MQAALWAVEKALDELSRAKSKTNALSWDGAAAQRTELAHRADQLLVPLQLAPGRQGAAPSASAPSIAQHREHPPSVAPRCRGDDVPSPGERHARALPPSAPNVAAEELPSGWRRVKQSCRHYLYVSPEGERFKSLSAALQAAVHGPDIAGVPHAPALRHFSADLLQERPCEVSQCSQYSITPYTKEDKLRLETILTFLANVTIRKTYRNVDGSEQFRTHSVRTGTIDQDEARQDCFGWIKHKGSLQESAISKRYPQALPMFKQFMDHHCPGFTFSSVYVNYNTVCKKHLDSANTQDSIIVGIGDYSGGQTVIYPAQGDCDTRPPRDIDMDTVPGLVMDEFVTGPDEHDEAGAAQPESAGSDAAYRPDDGDTDDRDTDDRDTDDDTTPSHDTGCTVADVGPVTDSPDDTDTAIGSDHARTPMRTGGTIAQGGVPIDISVQSLRFNGARMVHESLPFRGVRYSLVFF